MSMKQGLRMFGDAGVDAVKKGNATITRSISEGDASQKTKGFDTRTEERRPSLFDVSEE